MKYHARLNGVDHVLERSGDELLVDGRAVPFAVDALGTDEIAIRLGDRAFRAFGRREAGGWRVRVRGHEASVALEDERTRAIRELTGRTAPAARERDLRAPMSGLVVKVLVEPGQCVQAGDGLVVVEAMKMENELRAEAAGRIASVETEAGHTVERDEVLVRFEEDA